MTVLRRPLALLRHLLVAAVVCGLLVQPVVAALAELHAAEHALARGNDHGHAHSDGHDGDAGHTHPVSDDGGEGDELSGFHGLLHACSGVGAADLLDVPFFNGACPPGSDPPMAVPDHGHFASPLTSPFRPPIV